MPKKFEGNRLVTFDNRFIAAVPLNKRRADAFKCVGVSSVLGKILNMFPRKLVFGFLDYGTSHTEKFEILGFVNRGSNHLFFLGTETGDSYRGSMITGGVLDYSTMETEMFPKSEDEKRRLCLYGTEIANRDTVKFKKIMSFPDFETPEELEMKILISGQDEYLDKKNEWLKNHQPVTD